LRDDASELGGVAFHFHEGAAQRGLLLAFGERLLEQASETVLLPLNPEKILNLLARTRAWDLCIEKRTAKYLSTREPGSFYKGLQTRDVLIAYAETDEMPKAPHAQIISSNSCLSSAHLVLRVRISRRR
jgi:hypothetical protein